RDRGPLSPAGPGVPSGPCRSQPVAGGTASPSSTPRPATARARGAGGRDDRGGGEEGAPGLPPGWLPGGDVPVLSRHRSHAARLEPGRARVPSSFAYVAYPVYGAYEVDHPHRSHLEQPVTRPDNTARHALVAGAALIVGALTLTACGGSAQADGDRDGKGGRQS